MSDVNWIKITTDMFDNRKIKFMRKMPEGDSIVLIWVMLLTMAGRCNAGGLIFLTENVPYTTKMLADELDFEENTVILALKTLEELNMVQRDNFISITNWGEYQNVDGLDKIREQTRQRVAKHRENKRLTESSICNVTCNATVTQCNATDKEEEKEKEYTPPISPPKGENAGKRTKKPKEFVPPTLEEVKAYAQKRNSPQDPVEFWEYFDTGNWIDSEGKQVVGWKQKFLTWESRKKERCGKRPEPSPTPKAPEKPVSWRDGPDYLPDWSKVDK